MNQACEEVWPANFEDLVDSAPTHTTWQQRVFQVKKLGMLNNLTQCKFPSSPFMLDPLELLYYFIEAYYALASDFFSKVPAAYITEIAYMEWLIKNGHS